MCLQAKVLEIVSIEMRDEWNIMCENAIYVKNDIGYDSKLNVK